MCYGQTLMIKESEGEIRTMKMDILTNCFYIISYEDDNRIAGLIERTEYTYYTVSYNLFECGYNVKVKIDANRQMT